MMAPVCISLLWGLSTPVVYGVYIYMISHFSLNEYIYYVHVGLFNVLLFKMHYQETNI